MASMTAGQSGKLQSDNLDTNYTFALRALTTLFFMWGFITCLNDILIPHLKGIFDLSYSQAMLVQFCFFGAYFLVSVPAGFLVKRIGYQKGIVIGLVIAALGCAMFYPAASLMSYPVFLLALFVLASGITVLQVSANPYVSNLGPAKTASARLNLTQAFNALGTTVAPFFGALLILDHTATALSAAESADSVKLPYLLLASALLILAAVFAWLKLPDLKIDHAPDIVVVNPDASIWQYRHLVLGVIAIFVYVGAEVAIGSFLVSFLSLPDIAGLTEQTAAHYIAY
jgi:FHS family L-fucose permease-like MFS transporter